MLPSAPLLAAVLLAQAASAGQLEFAVEDGRGTPLAGAAVDVVGPAVRSAKTDRSGRVSLRGLPAGTYAVTVSDPGFQAARREGVVVGAGGVVTVALTLTPTTLSSVATIGSVRARSRAISLPAGAAAANVVSGAQALATDPVSTVTTLDRIPGITSTTSGAVGANRASLGSPQVTQIRGALPYETQSLIDGHPVSVGADGTFSPLLVKPAFLQSIEVVKGPGATSLEQSAAIGGTVNYRLLEPTSVPHADGWIGADRYGGVMDALRATGSAGALGYAVALTTDGTPGPLQRFSTLSSALPLLYAAPPYFINGQQIVGLPIVIAPNPTAPQFAGSPGLARPAEPLAICCGALNTGYDSRGVLAKLRWTFAPRTSVTATFLSAASTTDLSGARAQDATPVVNGSIFAPPAGYAGTLPAMTPIPFDGSANVGLKQIDRQQLLELDLRTAVGGTGLLARLYQTLGNTYLSNQSGTAPFGFSGLAWGGITTCPAGAAFAGGTCVAPGGATTAPTTAFFNGQPASLTASSPGTWALNYDNVYGLSAQAQRTVGLATLTAGIDRSMHQSTQFVDSPAIPIDAYSLAPGSWQRETTALLQIQVPLAHDRIAATFADYLIAYESRYSGDGGATFATAGHAVNEPRLGLIWTPTADLDWRFGIGGSVAPPYINLLSSLGTLPIANTNGNATAYTQNANDGTIGPETAFGYDLGIDRRFRGLTASADVYLTNLRGLFLSQTTQNGTYTPPSGPNIGNTQPLYVTKTENLGQARFAGLEVELRANPQRGLGFVLQGALERAYPYDLGPGFYRTSAGPLTTNLAVIPDVNFQSSGPGYNGLSHGRIPYSQGYGELNWRSRSGLLARLGARYVGPNNPYNEPAFGIVSAQLTVPVGTQASLELSADNLTGAYGLSYESAFGGVPAPLVNGKLGATDGGNVGPTTIRLILRTRLQ